MARVSRLRAAARHYGATSTHRVTDLDLDLEASILSIDTLKSEEQSTEFSCAECCQASTCVCVVEGCSALRSTVLDKSR